MTSAYLPIILILFAFLLVGANAQEKTDREKVLLAGPVKTVRSKAITYTGEKPTGTGKAKEEDTVTYDKAGHEIERIMISDYGFPIGKQTQRFNSQGALSETLFVNEKGVLEERTVYVQEQGKLAQVLRYDAKGVLREKTVRIYDASGKLTQEVYYDPTIARAKTRFVYDVKGNVVEMSFFLADGQKAVAPVGPCLGGHRVVFTYDDKGQAITKTIYDIDGNTKKSWQYRYNEKGLYSEYSQKSVGSSVRHVFAYEYDANGNWIKETITSETDASQMEFIFDTMKRTANVPEEKHPRPRK